MGNNFNRLELQSVLYSFENQCFCCGILQKCSNSACIYHNLCNNCEALSYFKKFTICCLNPINPDSLKDLKSKYVCYKCENRLETNLFQICKCKLCKSCTEVGLSNENNRKCFDCNSSINRELFLNCYACKKIKEKKYLIRHQCGESICVDCIKQGSSTLQPDFENLSIECPNCSELYDESVLITILGEEKTRFLIQMFLRKKFDMAECPTCSNVFILENSHEDFYNCLNCRTYFCKQCRKDLNSCVCSYDFINNFKTLSISRNSTIYCPECNRPYIKNSKIQFQECVNIQCKSTFCSDCSVFKSQIDHHGLHYHNLNCRHYKKSSQLAKYSPTCIKCKMSNIPCKPSWEIENLRKWSA